MGTGRKDAAIKDPGLSSSDLPPCRLCSAFPFWLFCGFSTSLSHLNICQGEENEADFCLGPPVVEMSLFVLSWGSGREGNMLGLETCFNSTEKDVIIIDGWTPNPDPEAPNCIF